MRDLTLGQYYPTKSVVHRMDPRTKLLIMIAYMVMVFFCDTFFSFGFLAFFTLIAIFISRVPLGKVLRSLRPIFILVIITTLLTLLFYNDANSEPLGEWWIFRIYLSGIYTSLKLALRLILLVMGPSLMTFTSTPTELTDGLESLLKPLTLIRLPIHELALIMSIALRLVPTLVEETDKIVNAQKARGAAFDSKNPFKRAKAMLPVLIPLFVSAFRRADDLADAMDARCFKSAKGRTRMKILKFHLRDLFAALLWIAVFFCVLVLKYNWWSWAFIPVLGI